MQSRNVSRAYTVRVGIGCTAPTIFLKSMSESASEIAFHTFLTPTMVDARGGTPDFTCKCLNVRLRVSARTPQVGEPTPSGGTEYEPLYVGEDGISVVRAFHQYQTPNT